MAGAAFAVGGWAGGDSMMGLVDIAMLVAVAGLWPAYAFWSVLMQGAVSMLPYLLHGPDDLRPAAVVAWALLLGALVLTVRASRRRDTGNEPGEGTP